MSSMPSKIDEFYAWLDQGSNAMAEAGARESEKNGSAGVTQVVVMVEAGARESNPLALLVSLQTVQALRRQR
jgi:hypothetical protein